MPLNKIYILLVLVLSISSSFSQQISNPGNTKPWTYWWWMGSAVNKEDITFNLEQFADAGIGGVHIIPIYGVKGFEKQFLNFLSPAWMEMVKYTATECCRLNLGMDLTAGTGWPYGGPNVTTEFSSSKIIDLVIDAKENQELHFNVLDDLKTKTGSSRPLSIISANAYYNESTYDLLNYVEQDQILNYKAPHNCKIIVLALEFCLQKVKRAAPGGEGYVSDPFSSDAIKNYFESFDTAFANNNDLKPRAFYHDSYEYYNADWTRDLFTKFKIKRGYDLREKLPEFFSNDTSDVISRIRSDYRLTIAELHEEFIKAAADWTHKKRSLFRNQAHGSPSNLLDTYSAADIPETEVFGSPIFNIPGLNGDTAFTRRETVDPLILRFSSSAAHVTGKNLISSETGTWLTEHFHETLAKLKPEVDLLFLSGINHIFYHGIPYSPKDEQWPGWQFYAASNFGFTNPLWQDIPELNKYIERCQAVLRSGTPDNDVLLYFPVWDLWHSSSKGLLNFEMHNPEKWLFNTSFYNAAKVLSSSGFSFDYISDKQLQMLNAGNGKIKAGNSVYKAIIIPSCRFMPFETLDKLYKILKAGGKVIFIDSIPADVPGYFKYKERRTELNKTAIKIKQLNSYESIVSDANSLNGLLNRTGIINEAGLYGNKLGYIRRKTLHGSNYFIVNQNSSAIDEWIELANNDSCIIINDPVNGKTGLAKTKKTANGNNNIYLQLQPGESVILNTSNKVSNSVLWKYFIKIVGAIELTGPWKIDFIKGGPVLPESQVLNRLESWTKLESYDARRFAGTARYTIQFNNTDTTIKCWILEPGKVCESAKVYVNGIYAGSLWAFPYRLRLEDVLKEGINTIEIEVSNTPANRIRDLDIKGVNWKKFYDINMVDINYKKFDASSWELNDSGLLGPVILYPSKSLF